VPVAGSAPRRRFATDSSVQRLRLDGGAEGGYGRFVIECDKLINRRARQLGLELKRQYAACRQDAMVGTAARATAG
jgi:hypothetical protein